MKTLRQAIEEKLGQQVIIMGGNISHVFGIAVDPENGVLKYFTCDPDNFADTYEVRQPVLHDYIPEDLQCKAQKIRLVAHWGSRAPEKCDWDFQELEKLTDDDEKVWYHYKKLKELLKKILPA